MEEPKVAQGFLAWILGLRPGKARLRPQWEAWLGVGTAFKEHPTLEEPAEFYIIYFTFSVLSIF